MDKYKSEIGTLVSKLTFKAKVLFAGITTERLYPNYIAFETESSWGDSVVLFHAISLVFQWLINETLFTGEDFKEMIARVDTITPDTEDFPGILTSFALDACASVLDTLQFIIDRDDQYITNVAIYARDTVDMFIQERSDINALDSTIDMQIEHDNFMIKEKNRQRQLIAKLINMDLTNITDRMLDSLRIDEPIIDLSLLNEL